MPLFAFEFGLYPRGLVERTGLRRIVLCKQLSFDGQRRAAVPDFGGATLYLDVVRGMVTMSYARKVLHHEFFHIVDWRDDRELYRDDQWSALNAKGFAYGSGGKNAQGDSTMQVLTDAYPGFLNKYSTTGVEEDKAVVFANMLADPGVIERRTSEDPVLARKVERMKELLRSFSKEVDGSFWKKIGEVDRSAFEKPKLPRAGGRRR